MAVAVVVQAAPKLVNVINNPTKAEEVSSAFVFFKPDLLLLPFLILLQVFF